MTLGRMPSPRVLAAALEEAALESVLERVQRVLDGGFAEADHELGLAARARPLAMSSSTGRPFTRAEIAASVPGIEIDWTEPPALAQCGAELGDRGLRERRVLRAEHDPRLAG